MSLTIYSVKNSNNPDDEIVRFQTSKRINLKGYALVDRTFDADGDISNEFRHIFIFPDLEVQPGEFVRLYTGKGEYKKGNHSNGHVIHYLYWNAEECVWNDKGGDTATLIKYTVIDSEAVPPIVKK
jgi:hypothetical protein